MPRRFRWGVACVALFLILLLGCSLAADDPADLIIVPRFGSLGVIASMQPFHASPNGNVLEVWAVNIGPERASRAWNWKSIRDAGGRLVSARTLRSGSTLVPVCIRR